LSASEIMKRCYRVVTASLLRRYSIGSKLRHGTGPAWHCPGMARMSSSGTRHRPSRGTQEYPRGLLSRVLPGVLRATFTGTPGGTQGYFHGYSRGYSRGYSGVLTGRRERARAEHAAGLLSGYSGVPTWVLRATFTDTEVILAGVLRSTHGQA
jgi:hypothetical protein